MAGPPRSKGETLPVAGDELDRLKKQTDTKVPVPVLRPPAAAPNRNVVPARRNSVQVVVPPPPDGDDDSDEVVIEMSGEDDDDDDRDPRPGRSKSETLSDPATTQKLAETARGAPAPSTPPGPNRHIKRR